MKVYQEIDIQNPSEMLDILSDNAAHNLSILMQYGCLDELEENLESMADYEGISLSDLETYLCDEVMDDFPGVFEEDTDGGYEDEDEDEYEE